MFAVEIAIGQRVAITDSADQPEVRGREFIVFEQHPDNGVWWLQCVETGHVNKYWFARPCDMRIVEDSPVRRRPVVTFRTGVAALVLGQRGAWGFVAGERFGEWQIVHVPSAMKIGREVKNRTIARTIAAALDEAFPTLDAIAAENVRDVADIYNRFAEF